MKLHRSAEDPPAAPPFILVHGAWHGGWCWERVVARLRAAGAHVEAPTLRGASLGDDVAALVALLEERNVWDAVLCGHSYGGMVIAGVADALPERVAALVFLDAFVPADGQSLFDLGVPELRERFIARAAERGDGMVPPLSAERFGVNPADRAWVDACCVPQPLRCFDEPLKLRSGIPAARRAYVRASAYPNPAFDAFAARARADAAWTSYELACGHDAMIDDPDGVTAVLLREAARRA